MHFYYRVSFYLQAFRKCITRLAAHQDWPPTRTKQFVNGSHSLTLHVHHFYAFKNNLKHLKTFRKAGKCYDFMPFYKCTTKSLISVNKVGCNIPNCASI